MLRVNFIKESGIWHKHSVVGCALYKHPPFLQRCRFNYPEPPAPIKLQASGPVYISPVTYDKNRVIYYNHYSSNAVCWPRIDL